MLLELAALVSALSSCVEDDALAEIFAEAAVTGVIVVDRADGNCRTSNSHRLHTAYSPASTFKIPNSIIGLETGVLSGADHRLTWDGIERSIVAWNQDHTLRSAYRHSAVWYYQVVARRVGMDSMRQWVEELDYGNKAVTPAIDGFWLDGDLRISAWEQIQFLRKLSDRAFPLADRTYETMDTIMRYPTSLPGTLYAKTGWAVEPEPDIGWFVGWWKYNDNRWFFALNIDMPESVQPKTRIQLAERALQSLIE